MHAAIILTVVILHFPLEDYNVLSFNSSRGVRIEQRSCAVERKDKDATRVTALAQARARGRIDVPFKLSPSANAQAASARTMTAIFMFVSLEC